MGEVVNANLINVDYIMVRDNREDLGSISDDDEIWNSMNDADVGFYKDMSSLYGEYQIAGLGKLLILMVKVMMSRQVLCLKHLVLKMI